MKWDSQNLQRNEDWLLSKSYKQDKEWNIKLQHITASAANCVVMQVSFQ